MASKVWAGIDRKPDGDVSVFSESNCFPCYKEFYSLENPAVMGSELLIPVMLTDLPGAVMKTCSCLEEQAALSCVFGWEFIPGELV